MARAPVRARATTAKSKPRSAAKPKPASAWPKSSPALIQRFDDALPPHPDLLRRQMFGYPCAFVHGWVFAGLFQESVVIRAPAEVKAVLPELHGAANFNPMQRGNGMRDWYVVPQAIARDASALAGLLARALRPVLELPPKLAPSAKRASKRKPRAD